MLDPYKMVVVNLIASAFLFAGILFYKFIYPKKKINLFALLLIISILPIISILREGTYESGDFNIHIYRIMSFYDSLMEGHIMPSWAGEINATYGNPLFIFNYPLPYYVISFFHFIGISFISSMKIYLGLTLYLSGIFMYMWIKELTLNKLAAFTSAIFYIFSPYHLIDIHFRATPGESTIFLLVPLLFLFITKYSNNRKFIHLIFIILSTDLLFLAHPLLASVFFVLAFLYILFINIVNRNVKTAVVQLLSLFLGFIASIYIWISFILYAPYMFKLPIPSTIINLQFYPFIQLIFSPWRYGLLFQGPKGELAQIIGYAQIFVITVSIIMIILKKVNKKIKYDYIFWIIIFILTLFMMNPSSSFIWKFINFQFFNMVIPYGRLSLVLSVCTSVGAGLFVLSFSNSSIKKILIYTLLIGAIGSTILNWGQRRVIPEINDSILRKNVWISTITEGPVYFLSTKWADKNNLWFSKKPNAHLEIITGDGVVNETKRTSTDHSYTINAQTPITIKENTLYFPGWSLKSNNKNIHIYPNKTGIINAKLPQGVQKVELTYSDIPFFAIAKTISLISILLILLYCGFYALRNKLIKFPKL